LRTKPPLFRAFSSPLTSVHFSPIPQGLQTFELYLSFMSDGALSMVEISETPEATAYYSNVLNLPHPSPSPTPSPRPVAMPMPSLMPTPHVSPMAAPLPNPSPSPSPMAMGHGAASLAPMPRAGAGSGHVSSGGPVPAPISTAGSVPAGGGPSPSPITGGGAPHIGGGSGPSAAPAPTRATRGGGGGGGGSSGPAIAVAPSVARPTVGGGGEGVKGNPDANNNPNGRPSLDAQKDVDFGPYMADLQRRIKRAWFPARTNESKRVVVLFTVQKGGELSDLKLANSSGAASADQAALNAVQNVSPFRPLPSGRPNGLTMEFTFGHNAIDGVSQPASASSGMKMSNTVTLEHKVEKRHIRLDKQTLRRNELWAYVEEVKQQAESSWQKWRSPNEGKLMTTSIKVSLDARGRVADCKIETSTATSQQTQSIQDFIRSQKFRRLPQHLQSIDLFWTLISEGTSNAIEFTDSHTANNYNMNLLGGMILRSGIRDSLDSDTDSLLDAREVVNFSSEPRDRHDHVDVTPYIAYLKKNIQRAWFPPKNIQSTRVRVQFKIDHSGSLSNLRIDHSSGSAIADQAALKAVESAAPFRPLPAGAPEDINIQFTFDYNVFGGGGHGTFRSF
jgi:TonB family protein